MKKNMNNYNLFGTILLALIFTTNQAMLKPTIENKDVELQNIFAKMYKNYSPEMETKAADLIKAGANPNLLVGIYAGLSTELVNMPLLLAIARMPVNGPLGNKFRDLAKLLIKHGANINVQDNHSYTPLIGAAGGGRTDIAQLLIDAGADVNTKDNEGDTALMEAIGSMLFGHNSSDMAKLLIKAGADVNVKDNKGYTPLIQAAMSGDKDIVKLLIAAGADPNNSKVADFGDVTALMVAVLANRDMVELLIKAGADVNAKDNKGNTPLMLAIKESRSNTKKDIIKLLIDAHADINAKNNSQENALDLAKKAGDPDIIKMLQDASKAKI